MDSSLGSGFMAVFAVSGSVVFLAMQVHKRLLSKFMEEMEFEMRNSTERVKEEAKKKVRFAEDVGESIAREKGRARRGRYKDENLEGMPQNWQAMYKGIMQYRNLQKGYN